MAPSEPAPSAVTHDADSSTAAAVSSDANDTPAVSWEGPTYARSRSIVVGCVVAILVGLAVIFTVGVAAIVVSGSVSVDALLVGVVLLLVGGPVSLLYAAIAYGESTDREKQSLRREFRHLGSEWSWLRPGWVGGGALGAISLIWWLSGITSSAGSLALVFIAFLPLVFSVGHSNYRLDPGNEVLEIELSYGEYTHERTLGWLVGVRRLRLGSVSLFVCANRGKRWYEGVHFMIVPDSVADSVDDILQRAAQTEPPRRVKRDERIIIGAIGTSMVGIGPLLYLLSGEPALLFILAGPSTLIGLGVVVHALRG